MTTEYLRSNVIGSSDGRIRHQSSGLSPVVDDTTVTDSKVDLVKIYGVAVCRSARLSLEEALVIRVVVEFVETSG